MITLAILRRDLAKKVTVKQLKRKQALRKKWSESD